jgi:aryl-phospho-beta-D-glucosidase BglC (GH1 family)
MYGINIDRRAFIKNTTLAATSVAFTKDLASEFFKSSTATNKLPRWKGFNLLDYFSPTPGRNSDINKTTEDDLKWMEEWGFNFVRLPMAYPRYLNPERGEKITKDDFYKFDTKVLDEIDQLIYTANKHSMHLSLNLHRAPGYCINAGFFEPFNLWKDKEAQDAFYFHWGMWAERYKKISSDKISFDLLNEPAFREDLNDQFSRSSTVPGELYRMIAEGAVKAIRAANPNHLIIADGNNVGNNIVPELFDLNIAQSCRGYFPHYISHFQAPWVFKDPSKAPIPVWPGTIEGKFYGREQLEEYYKQWIGLLDKGVGVHCGECGCWKKTPHNVFLAWFGDVLDILTKSGIGYALWNFRGDFGIMDSGRADVNYTEWYGHKLDTKLLELLKMH